MQCISNSAIVRRTPRATTTEPPMTTTSTSAPARAQRGDHDPLRLVVEDQLVPTVDGRRRRSINLDHAASTPALVAVHEAVERFVPWYSSIHRGAGYRSQVASRAYEGARAAVADFVDADDDQVVVLVRNTTEALNVLASARRAGEPRALLLDGAPREPAALAPARPRDDAVRRQPRGAARDVRAHARPRALPAVRPARRDGRVERDGRALADPRARSAGARARRADRRRRRPARPAPARSACATSASTISPSRVTSCTRPTAPAR